MEFSKRIKTVISLPWVQTLCQLFLGGIFVYAGLSKIVSPVDFAESIRNFQIITGFAIHVMTYLLPLLEIIFGAFLILNFYPKLSALFLSSLLIVFIVALAFTLVRGININCGCFIQTQLNPGLKESNQIGLILRDLGFLIPGIIIIMRK